MKTTIWSQRGSLMRPVGSRLRDFEVSSTWDEVGVLGDGHEGLDVGDKVRI